MSVPAACWGHLPALTKEDRRGIACCSLTEYTQVKRAVSPSRRSLASTAPSSGHVTLSGCVPSLKECVLRGEKACRCTATPGALAAGKGTHGQPRPSASPPGTSVDVCVPLREDGGQHSGNDQHPKAQGLPPARSDFLSTSTVSTTDRDGGHSVGGGVPRDLPGWGPNKGYSPQL